METTLLMFLSFAAYIVAYNTYGKFLSRKIFKINPDTLVPSKELNDGVDYVPSRKGIIFGHHFTSIAGTGPIVGPAIGIIWGWLPALLWVLVGSIVIGAVHDFGTLVISLRNQGKSISEITAKYINPRARLIFFFIVFLALLIIIAIFGVVIAIVFKIFPSSILPVWIQIPIAIILGFAVYKKNASVWLSTAVAVFSMYVFIIISAFLESRFPNIFNIADFNFLPATGSWTIILLVYGFIASTLPVTTLLQPRDYINGWQLFLMMGLLILGAVVSDIKFDMPLTAPIINTENTGAPPIFPMMFVVIACGAVSGFHSLVASGTSPKQISKETDSLFIGYGSMLVESALAVLVLICVSAGIAMGYKSANGDFLTGYPAWNSLYSSWSGAQGLGANIKAVVLGASNMLNSIGISRPVGNVIMGVFIASFAGTTLDTAVRLQRYIISELATDFKIKPLQGKFSATTFAVITAAAVAFATGADGKGAMILWPLFGTVNQLLAALALLVVTMYLKHKGGSKFIIAALPCLFMAIATVWALLIKLSEFKSQNQYFLLVFGCLILILALWMFVEACFVFCRRKIN